MSSLPSFLPIDSLPDNSASRQNAQNPSATGLAPAYETRVIVLAQGVHFTSNEGEDLDPSTYLQNNGLDMTKLADKTYLHTSDAQLINYILFITTDRTVFREAMMEENIILIYAGHARHGQGACFHLEDVPGEWWNDGDASENGIFRMGYPFIAIPVGDIIENRYTANPLLASADKPPRDPTQLHPKLIDNYSAIRSMTVNDLSSDATEIVILSALLPDGPYWGVVCRGDSGRIETHLVMICDWQNSTTSPNDLGASQPACHCFCDFGCSTLIHAHKVFRNLLGWTKDGDQNLAYWTSAPAPPAVLAPVWLYNLFNYPKVSAFLDWEPSINYAVSATNRQMPAISPSLPFKII